MNTKDYRPKSGKVEWHITYKCNLRCVGCNRFAFLNDTHTPDMTLDDAKKCCEEAPKYGFHTVIILGGEPTLHPDFLNFVDLGLKHFNEVYVFTNGATQDSQLLLSWALAKGVVLGNAPQRYSIVHSILDYCVAPIDLGITREPCYLCSCNPGRCGISLDSVGYTFCCIGGALDAVLGLGARTPNLSDLFDPDFIVEHQRKLCSHCGCTLGLDKKFASSCKKKYGILMSETWLRSSEKWEAYRNRQHQEVPYRVRGA